MTVPELITTLLASIRREFYAERIREFKRDERALTKAITRYGYECNYRGWEFEVSFIFADILAVLRRMKERQADIQYLPSYLEGAMSRHVGQRSEELRAQAQSARPKVEKILQGTAVVKVVMQATNIEMLSAFYQHQRQLQQVRRAKKSAKKVAPELQAVLW